MNKKLIALIIGLITIVGVGAVLVEYFGQITATVDVNRAVEVTGENCEDGVCTESYSMSAGEIMTSEIYTATSQTSVNVPLELTTEVNPDDVVSNNIEYLVDAEAIVWDGTTGYSELDTEFEAGREFITILLTDTTLGTLGDIDFEQYVIAGYPVSVNILLDVNGDGEFNSLKDLTTGFLTDGVDDVLKIEFAYNGATAGYPDAYMEAGDYNTWAFAGMGTIDSDTTAWLYSVKPGGAEIVEGTLVNWKLGINRGTSCYYVTDDWYEEVCEDITINSDTRVYGIQIESLGWIAPSESKIRNIKINGDEVSPDLLPNDNFRFDVETIFGLTNTGTYTITTTVDLE